MKNCYDVKMRMKERKKRRRRKEIMRYKEPRMLQRKWTRGREL